MAIHDEVGIGCVLVLADACFQQRRVCQPRETKSDVLAGGANILLIHNALTISRIEPRSADIAGNLESMTAIRRHAVEEPIPVIGPNRKLALAESRIAGRSSKEE